MSTTYYEYKPQVPIAPAETIKEYLDANNMTQKELSKRTGLTEQYISKILKGEAGISIKTALAFEKVFSVEADFWIRLDMQYRLLLERQRIGQPVLDMIKTA